MADFKIEISGDFNGYISWRTAFSDDNQIGDADALYIINIAQELAHALKAIHKKRLDSQKTDAKA